MFLGGFNDRLRDHGRFDLNFRFLPVHKRFMVETPFVEVLNVITVLNVNKFLNVITFGPKCNKALNVITFGPKCNKAPMQSFNCANVEM